MKCPALDRLVSLTLTFPSATSRPQHVRALLPIQVYFSPKGGCTEAVVDALSKAKSTVLVQAYSFTSAPIAKALTDAHRRGVKIQVILDKSNQTDKYSAATFTQTLRTASLTNASNQWKRDADSARVWFI